MGEKQTKMPDWLKQEESTLPEADPDRWAKLRKAAADFARNARPLEADQDNNTTHDTNEEEDTAQLTEDEAKALYRSLSLQGRHKEAQRVWDMYKNKK